MWIIWGDYQSGGQPMTGRTFSSEKYRFGFNGKENDNEVKGTGNQIDFGARIHDPRLGRFLSIDPITIKYPELTPYQFAKNTPIRYVDIDGLEGGEPKKNTSKTSLSLYNSKAIMSNTSAISTSIAFGKLVQNALESSIDTPTRIVTTVATSLVGGFYYGATDKMIEPFAYSFSFKDGFENIGDPESDENDKKLAKATVGLIIGKGVDINIKNNVVEAASNLAVGVVVDKVLDAVLPTPEASPNTANSKSTPKSSNTSDTAKPKPNNSAKTVPFSSEIEGNN